MTFHVTVNQYCRLSQGQLGFLLHFAVRSPENVTDYWTFHQPDDYRDVSTQLLRTSAAVVRFVNISLCVKKVLLLN